MKVTVTLSFLYIAVSAVTAQAADICDAVALREVPAIESPESILKRGEHDDAITQYRVNKKNGEGSFCSHGGYCYPTYIDENGTMVEVTLPPNFIQP